MERALSDPSRLDSPKIRPTIRPVTAQMTARTTRGTGADESDGVGRHRRDKPSAAPATRALAAYRVCRLTRAGATTAAVGVDGTILHIDKKVSTGTAGADIAATLARPGIAKRATR